MILVLTGATASAQTNYDARIAVILPFKAKLSEGPKSLEFYRGFLMAADYMKRNGYNVKIIAYDEQEPSTDLYPTLDKAFDNADLTIGCYYRNHIITASGAATFRGKKALFPFATYIPQEATGKAGAIFTIPSPSLFTQQYTKLLLATAGKCNLVYVKSSSPQTSAETEDLAEKLRKKGCKAVNVETCSATAIASVLTQKRTNIIVTDTNDRDFIDMLLESVSSANASLQYDVRVAGTSGWIEHADHLLHPLPNCSLMLPTTWFQSASNPEIQFLFDYYKEWFHDTPSSILPSPFIIGYELGLFAIANLKAGIQTFPAQTIETPQYIGHYNFSTTYDMDCYSNGAVRLINCAADGSISQINMR